MANAIVITAEMPLPIVVATIAVAMKGLPWIRMNLPTPVKLAQVATRRSPKSHCKNASGRGSPNRNQKRTQGHKSPEVACQLALSDSTVATTRTTNHSSDRTMIWQHTNAWD